MLFFVSLHPCVIVPFTLYFLWKKIFRLIRRDSNQWPCTLGHSVCNSSKYSHTNFYPLNSDFVIIKYFCINAGLWNNLTLQLYLEINYFTIFLWILKRAKCTLRKSFQSAVPRFISVNAGESLQFRGSPGWVHWGRPGEANRMHEVIRVAIWPLFQCSPIPQWLVSPSCHSSSVSIKLHMYTTNPISSVCV